MAVSLSQKRTFTRATGPSVAPLRRRGELGEYFLDPNYGSIFTEAGENGPGSIWEIQYANNTGGNWGAQFWSDGLHQRVPARSRHLQRLWLQPPDQDFVDEFEVWTVNDTTELTDPRLGYTVYKISDNASVGGKSQRVNGHAAAVLRAEVLQPCLRVGAVW